MDNRKRLLDCALSLFSQYGYNAVSVSDIVTAVGVTKPTLYHYFGSKNGLLTAMLQHRMAPFLSTLNRAANYQGDIVSTLEKIVIAYFDFAERSNSFYRLQLTLYFAPPESEMNKAVRLYTKRQRTLLESVFKSAAEDHGNMRGRHERYTAGFLGAINAVIGLYLNGKLELTNEVLDETVHQFMHGIFS